MFNILISALQLTGLCFKIPNISGAYLLSHILGRDVENRTRAERYKSFLCPRPKLEPKSGLNWNQIQA